MGVQFPHDQGKQDVRLIHERDGETRTLATQVETADSFLSQARGLMFRRSIPDEYALIFRFDDVAPRDVHMMFVPFPLDVLWLVEEEIQRKERLRSWVGFAKTEADTLIELPAGAAGDVHVGDRVYTSAAESSV